MFLTPLWLSLSPASASFQVHQASLEGAHKVAWRRRPPQEGGGRAILSQTEYLVVQDDGTIQVSPEALVPPSPTIVHPL